MTTCFMFTTVSAPYYTHKQKIRYKNRVLFLLKLLKSVIRLANEVNLTTGYKNYKTITKIKKKKTKKQETIVF